jgi:hypothetical protein
MNEWERFEKLVRSAREESIPPIDVSARVVRQLRLQVQPPPAYVALSIFAGISSAAAAVVGVVAYNAWLSMQDPIVGLLCSLDEVLR